MFVLKLRSYVQSVRYLAFSIVLLNLNIQVSMLFYENVFMYEYLEGFYSSNKITSHVMFEIFRGMLCMSL